MKPVFLTLLGIALACGPSQERAQRLVDAWLLCEECDDGEADSVLAVGDPAVQWLRAALLAGPSTDARANVTHDLQATYQSTRAFLQARNLTVPVNQDEHVRHYLDNFVALYQVRAAHALGRIGGSAARDALNAGSDSAAMGRYRPDVGAAIRFALDSLLVP